jgi:hypothetical protein
MDAFCTDIFESLEQAVASLSPDASVQDVAKVFIRVIHDVYASHSHSAHISCSEDNLSTQINNSAAMMLQQILQANNHYLQQLYMRIASGLNQASDLVEQHRNAISSALAQHYSDVLEIENS